MNHAQNHSLNFEFLFKGSIRSDAPPKPLRELLQNELSGGSRLLSPTEELLLWVVACAASELEVRTLPSQTAHPGLGNSDPSGWIRAMEDFDRF